MEGVPTSQRETLPPLPTKEDRLYGALLIFRKANEGPHLRKKIRVTGRDISLLQNLLLAENLKLKEKYKLTDGEYESLHVSLSEIKNYIQKQDDVAIDGDISTRILRPYIRKQDEDINTEQIFFGVPVPKHKPVKPPTEVD